LGWVGLGSQVSNPTRKRVGLGPGLGHTGHLIELSNLPKFTNNKLLSLIKLNTNLFNLIEFNKTLNLKIYQV